ncbi:hypothetical protein LLO_0597 [Legionella longbeachae NSW150]|uniref:Uncharacterized protein n=1 Tax=Legionella longbeachae serogroup 1 (strain NSW150) TaxID=661367 RepID=D3HPW8_LEGLN|nr:hypothetical protein LLO_0597 [Legionella longbeachae NSW150]
MPICPVYHLNLSKRYLSSRDHKIAILASPTCVVLVDSPIENADVTQIHLCLFLLRDLTSK